jgi:hypothetical protein
MAAPAAAVREVLDAKWADFDLPRRAWRIPISKSGKARHVSVFCAWHTARKSVGLSQDDAALRPPEPIHPAGCGQCGHGGCRGSDAAARHDGPSIRTACGFAGLVIQAAFRYISMCIEV